MGKITLFFVGLYFIFKRRLRNFTSLPEAVYMKVVYTAPNRGHHYRYAAAFHAAGCLDAFVSGFPRISPRANAPGLDGKLYRADVLQTLYIAGLKAGLPDKISARLAYLAKVEQDLACRKFVKQSDIFLFYNGSGLSTSRYGRKKGVINIVEAVNSHVDYQEALLAAEYKHINLPWKPFPKYEKSRRLKEYKEADYILLPSEFVKRSFMEKGFPEEKLVKVPYGFDKLRHFEAIDSSEDRKDEFTVLYVGSISVRKGLRYLIEGFKELTYPKKKLVIVGPDVHEGALNGITLTTDIVFTGTLKGRELEDTYRSADVFCLPSVEEGLALVLGEAISFGLPIIATCNTGADDIILDGKEGYIIPIRDSEAIRQKLQLLADTPDLLKQIRTNSYAKSGDLNGWKETGKNLVDALYKVFRHSHQ